MTILRQDELPTRCPCCDLEVNPQHSQQQACSDACGRGGVDAWIEMTQHGSKLVVHVHHSCNRCAFEWLSEPHNQAEVDRVW